MVNDLIHMHCIEKLCEVPEDSTTVVSISGGNLEFKAASVCSIRSRRSWPTDIPIFDDVVLPPFDARATEYNPYSINRMGFWLHT